jgi:hypothetical protein
MCLRVVLLWNAVDILDSEKTAACLPANLKYSHTFEAFSLGKAWQATYLRADSASAAMLFLNPLVLTGADQWQKPKSTVMLKLRIYDNELKNCFLENIETNETTCLD